MTSPTTKTAIITGSARGIGAAIARRLAADGMNVVINYASNGALADKLVADIAADGGSASAVQGDVSRTDDFARLFQAAEDRFGGVDVLFNNAGIMKIMTIADLDDDAFDRMFAINVRGVVNGCRIAAQRMRDGGRIINLSTSVLGMSPPGYGPYCASKAAVEAITRSLSKELGKRGIRVNSLSPGPTDTELLTDANSEDRLKMYISMTPLGRLGAADDIANVASFLASDASGWITGQTIRANGGMVV